MTGHFNLDRGKPTEFMAEQHPTEKPADMAHGDHVRLDRLAEMTNREARAALRFRAMQLAEQTGCCGHHDQRYQVECVSYDETHREFDRFTLTKCHLTWRVCQAAQLEWLVDLFGRLNS